MVQDNQGRRLPDFIVIGAAKAGTTSLADHLGSQPQVFMSRPKEPEFFARDDVHARGPDWYAALFAQARPDQIAGEASTLYSLATLFPQTPGRVAAALPQVKLIYILREPVSRAYSYYVQLQKNYRRWTGDTRVHRSFEDFLDPGRPRAPRERAIGPHDAHLPDRPELILDGSDYPAQIAAWLQHVNRERMLFLTFEEMRDDPAAVFARVHEFLGIPAPDPAADLPGSNISERDFARLRREQTQAALSRLPVLGRLGRILPKPLRQALRTRLVRAAQMVRGSDPGRPPEMLPETRRRLAERFGRDRAGLKALTGLDLDRWWGDAP